MEESVALNLSFRRHKALYGALTFCAMLCTPAPAQSRYQLVHERDVAVPLPLARRLSFTWSGHYLLDRLDNYTSAPLLVVFDEGHNVERISQEMTGAAEVSVISYASGLDGSIALSGGASGPGPRGATHLTWISPDRKQRVVTRIWPYAAHQVAIAADGTIWAAGFLKTGDNLAVVADNLIRRFDTSGKMLASFGAKPRRFRKEDPVSAVYYAHLLASRDRVGWFTGGDEYIEFSLAGEEIGRYDGPVGVDTAPGEGSAKELCGVGLSQQNELSTCVYLKADDAWQILTLNRATGNWELALPAQKGYALLLGYDGETLVTNPLRAKDGWVLRRYTRGAGSPGAK